VASASDDYSAESFAQKQTPWDEPEDSDSKPSQLYEVEPKEDAGNLLEPVFEKPSADWGFFCPNVVQAVEEISRSPDNGVAREMTMLLIEQGIPSEVRYPECMGTRTPAPALAANSVSVSASKNGPGGSTREKPMFPCATPTARRLRGLPCALEPRDSGWQ
jgi:hypothetical protein